MPCFGLRFSVETDDPGRPVWSFALRANLVPAWQVESLGVARQSLLLGQSGEQTLRITARRKSDRGRGLPQSVSATPPLTAVFKGEPSESIGAGGLTEATQDVVVKIPSGKNAGPGRGDIFFQWADNRIETNTIGWEVRPRLKVSPSGLVLGANAQPTSKKVVVTSDGRPFRLKRVRGPALAEHAEVPQGTAIVHELSLLVGTSSSPLAGATDITIETDHPDQPIVSVSVLVVPSAPVHAEGRDR
jgi:hypothetical protein